MAHHDIADLIGDRFGVLTVIEKTAERYNQQVVWLCECECGTRIKVAKYFLVNSRARHCGCRPDLDYVRLDLRTPIPPTKVSIKRAYERLIKAGGYAAENLAFKPAPRWNMKPETPHRNGGSSILACSEDWRGSGTSDYRPKLGALS